MFDDTDDIIHSFDLGFGTCCNGSKASSSSPIEMHAHASGLNSFDVSAFMIRVSQTVEFYLSTQQSMPSSEGDVDAESFQGLGLQESVPEQAAKVTLGTRRLALGLFWPTGATGVPSCPVLPQNWLPDRLLHQTCL